MTKIVLAALMLLALQACDPFRVKIVTLSPAPGGPSDRSHTEAFEIVEEVAGRNGLRSSWCTQQESTCKAFDGAVYVEAYVLPAGEFRIRIVDSSAISAASRIEDEIASALRHRLGYVSATIR